MKCPKCGKDVELQKRQIGLDDNGEPIMNEFAICRDCKKKWNLDKQRQKKIAAKSEVKEKPVVEPAAEAVPEVVVEAAVETAPEVVVEAVSEDHVPQDATKVIDTKKVADAERPVKKARKNPSERPASERPAADRPAKKRRPAAEEEAEPLGNIPSEKVRKKREAEVKKNYEEMLAADNRPAKKKRPAEAPKPVKPVPAPEPETEEYEAVPRFKVFRILLGILSILGGGYFAFRAFMGGLDGITAGGQITTGLTYLVLAACIILSGLLTVILKSCLNRVAFVIPFILCAVGGVFSFLNKQGDQWLLYGAIACVVLAAIYLLLTILGACVEDEDDDWDDDDDDDEDDEY